MVIPELENAKPPSNQWSEQEEKILIKYYGKVPVRELVKYMGRTFTAITDRAICMGITKTTPGRNNWTERDEKIVIRYYGKKNTREIANYLGRNTEAIKHKAHRLGLLFNDIRTEMCGDIEIPELEKAEPPPCWAIAWDVKSTKLLESLYSNTDSKEIARILHKPLNSIHCKAAHLGLLKENPHNRNKPRNRTIGAVKYKAGTMGLHFKENDDK